MCTHTVHTCAHTHPPTPPCTPRPPTHARIPTPQPTHMCYTHVRTHNHMPTHTHPPIHPRTHLRLPNAVQEYGQPRGHVHLPGLGRPAGVGALEDTLLACRGRTGWGGVGVCVWGGTGCCGVQRGGGATERRGAKTPRCPGHKRVCPSWRKQAAGKGRMVNPTPRQTRWASAQSGLSPCSAQGWGLFFFAVLRSRTNAPLVTVRPHTSASARLPRQRTLAKSSVPLS